MNQSRKGLEAERFEAICRAEAERAERLRAEGINTYGEKRLHRILKQAMGGEEGEFEAPVGRYLADVRVGQTLYEIQTGSLRPLVHKLRAYLEQTSYHIVVVVPLFASKQVIRMEQDSGEVLRRRRVYRGGRAMDGLPKLYPIAPLLREPRLHVLLCRIHAEEHRYSERIRYRKAGAYDRELFPRSLEEMISLEGPSDFTMFLPTEPDRFTAAQYGAWSKLKNRDLYSALNTLCALGLLERETVGNRYEYQRTQSPG